LFIAAFLLEIFSLAEEVFGFARRPFGFVDSAVAFQITGFVHQFACLAAKLLRVRSILRTGREAERRQAGRQQPFGKR